MKNWVFIIDLSKGHTGEESAEAFPVVKRTDSNSCSLIILEDRHLCKEKGYHHCLHMWPRGHVECMEKTTYKRLQIFELKAQVQVPQIVLLQKNKKINTFTFITFIIL